MVEIGTPCVLGIIKPDYEPRYPTMKSKMAARKKDVPVVETGVALLLQLRLLRFMNPLRSQQALRLKKKVTKNQLLRHLLCL